MNAAVVGVHRDDGHRFSKPAVDAIRLLEGLGVQGDAHCGRTVQHRSRVRKDPGQPNLRQVHLIAAELHEELARNGFTVGPGDLGENITTRGVDLLGLSTGTRLRLGGAAVVEITGLRNPCVQLDRFQDGLMKAVLGRDADGNVVRKAGVLAVVVAGGEVRAGDSIVVERPSGEHRPLQPI